MDKEIKNEKSCNDCISFIQHYGKDNIYYHTVGCGHCKNRPNRNLFRKKEICEHFEEKDPEKLKEKQNKSIINLLSDIADSLTKLEEFFKNEN